MSTFERLAQLALTVESYELEGLTQEVSSAFRRETTVVRLIGRGERGLGEEVTYDAGAQHAFRKAGPSQPLAGRYSLAEFSTHLGELDLVAGSSCDPDFRRWAFESAALDLALRQHGRSLAAQLGIDPRPVRFVVSLGLGRPPTLDRLRVLLRLYPGLRFKLDATSAWDDRLVGELAGIGVVDVLDLKGAYRGTPVDQPADPALYARVSEGLPEAWIEDPDLTPETEAVLAAHRARITWDAPIHSVRDILALPFPPRVLNVKPSRFGRLSELFASYDYCRERGIELYGGGQFELGPGRGQIQYLASLFHPDAPNDVAPGGYNARRPVSGLPESPLEPRPSATGFAWT